MTNYAHSIQLKAVFRTVTAEKLVSSIRGIKPSETKLLVVQVDENEASLGNTTDTLRETHKQNAKRWIDKIFVDEGLIFSLSSARYLSNAYKEYRTALALDRFAFSPNQELRIGQRELERGIGFSEFNKRLDLMKCRALGATITCNDSGYIKEVTLEVTPK